MTSDDPSLINCSLCNKPVDLTTAKTNEAGKAVHEECYVLIQGFNQATQCAHQQTQTSCQGSDRASS